MTDSSPGRKVLFSLATALAFFLAVEGALWLAGVETTLQREDPFRGFSDLVTVFHRDGDSYRTRADDLHTFNDQQFLAEKPEGGLRIFCLGGSSAYGFPWTAREAFSGILQDVLAATYPERSVEVINAAGISYGIHRLQIVADELLAYEPDVFIVYSGHNEFVEPAYYEALKDRGRGLDRLTYIASGSRLVSVLRRLREAEGEDADAMFGLRVERDQSAVFDEGEKREVVSEFRRGLASLVEAARRRGVAVVLATVPCNLRDWRPQRSAGATALAAERQETWTRAVSAGRRRLAGGDAAGAVEDLLAATEISPGFAETHYLLGQAYERIGRWEEARASFSTACDADASPIRRVSAINEATRQVAGETDSLLVDLDEVFESESPHGLVGSSLIEDYVHPTLEGHRLIARRLLDAMTASGILIDPGRGGRELFDRVVAARPAAGGGNAVWLFNQAYLLENQGRSAEATAKYEQALLAKPNYVDALRNLSRLYVAAHRFAEAETLTARLQELAPRDPASRMLVADAYARSGETERALEEYRRLVAERPDSPRVLNQLGALLVAAGRFEEARVPLERALVLESDDASVHRHLGAVHDGLEQYDAAVEHFREAQQLEPGERESYFNLGVVYFKMGRAEEAIRELELALELDPDYAAAHYNLGVVYGQLVGDPRRSAEHFAEANRIDPTLTP